MLSSNFINRVIAKLDSMNTENLKEFILHLKEDREFFNIIFNTMDEAVVAVDENKKIGYINTSAKQILGIPKDEILDKEFFHYLRDNELRSYLSTALESRSKILNAELNVGYPNIKVLKINILPLVEDEQVVGDVIMLDDITDDKIRSLKLRRAESLAALTTLAAGIAHEIKNPLGSIDIHIQLISRLLEKINSKETEEIQTLLEVIEEEIDRLNNIVKNFLFSVRPVDLQTDKIDMYRFLLDLSNFMKYEAEEKGIEVKFDIKQPIPSIYADPRYLKPAFINIVKNAIEACESGDSIEITAKEQGIDIEIQISDSGIGISQETLDKIFEPYYTTKDTGTGLGLTIVYKIIREHGGSIKVDSIEGKGTTFTIIMPTDKVPEKRKIEYSG